MRIRKRYPLLRLVCNVGRIVAVLLLVYGLVSLVLTPMTGGSYTPTAVVFGAAISMYIACEGALVLVAIEGHARRMIYLLREGGPDDGDDDEGLTA